MKMNNHIVGLLLALCFAIISCDTIHEFPDPDNPIDPTLIRLKLNLKLNANSENNFYNNEVSTAYTSTKAPSFDQMLRITIDAYLDGSQKVVQRQVVYVDKLDPTQAEASVEFILNAAKYRFAAWADYVTQTHKIDQYYSTTDGLHMVSFIEMENFDGCIQTNTDNRDCFWAYTHEVIDLTPFKGQWYYEEKRKIALKRPVAKYVLVANDVDKFIARLIAKDPNRTRAEIDTYTAQIIYEGFMLNSFNVRDSVPNGSRTGLHYDSEIRLLPNDPTKAVICFDYPLVKNQVHNERTSVTLRIYDHNRVLINELGDVAIKIKRDSLTIIESDFFTRSYVPGITIKPDYDGIIDVEIPD